MTKHSGMATVQPTQQSRTGEQRIIAAFDFDGTISTSDSLRDFLLDLVGPIRFAAGVLRTMPWLIGMLLRLCDRGTAKARLLAVTIGGTSRSELNAAAIDYATRRLPLLIRPEMAERIRAHQACGHELVLVSASPSVYLSHWAASVGFDAVLATELDFRDNRFSGRLAGPNCWGPEKVRRLQRWQGEDTLRELYAYGDSRGDREMLALADHSWLRGSGPLPEIKA
jgi:phosphatidylglycerophosphatase C